jgi:hypothetical protein
MYYKNWQIDILDADADADFWTSSEMVQESFFRTDLESLQ